MITCSKTTRLLILHSGVDYIGSQQRVSRTYSSALKDANYANSTEDWYGNGLSKPLYLCYIFAALVICATIVVLVFI